MQWDSGCAFPPTSVGSDAGVGLWKTLSPLEVQGGQEHRHVWTWAPPGTLG